MEQQGGFDRRGPRARPVRETNPGRFHRLVIGPIQRRARLAASGERVEPPTARPGLDPTPHRVRGRDHQEARPRASWLG